MTGDVYAVWPKEPYKGLACYSEADSLIFAGREARVLECARRLADGSTRMLILHGRSGCGKSSFLRAGLIQRIEREAIGLKFARTAMGNANQVVFVRCTSTPIQRLYEQLQQFASQPFEFMTPRGAQTLDLSAVVHDYHPSAETAESPEQARSVLDAFASLSKLIPSTLIFAIDQAEELLTLNLGEPARQNFFDFLAKFLDTPNDIKLILALRSEYFGAFHEALRSVWNQGIATFLLNEPSQADIKSAIEWPTRRSPIGQIPSPYDTYGFAFEAGLPEAITRDLFASAPAGGILPMMQLVCNSLYQKAKADQSSIITLRDYIGNGDASGQIENYITRSLCNASRRLGLPQRLLDRETTRWWRILCSLARQQPDGSIATYMEREIKLVRIAQSHGATNPSEMLRALTGADVLLLRSAEIKDATSATKTISYFLAHDAIAFALLRRDQENGYLSAFYWCWARIRAVIDFLQGRPPKSP